MLALLVQTPVGALIDRTHAKRALIVVALAFLAAGAVVIYAWPAFWPVLTANAAMAMVGDVFGPAVAALTLGLFLHADLARRLGRNAAFDHAGNVASAAVAGAIGWMFTQRTGFLLAFPETASSDAGHTASSDAEHSAPSDAGGSASSDAENGCA